MRKERILVFGTPFGGNDIQEVEVDVTEKEYDDGDHFDKAIEKLKESDFEPKFAVHVGDELPKLAAQLVSKYPDIFALAIKVHKGLAHASIVDQIRKGFDAKGIKTFDMKK